MADLTQEYRALSVDELEALLRDAILTPDAKAQCKSVINEKLGTPRYDVPNAKISQGIAMSQTNDYATSIEIAKLVSFLGWIAVIAGAGITMWLSEGVTI
jgi:hypothetical protein